MVFEVLIIAFGILLASVGGIIFYLDPEDAKDFFTFAAQLTAGAIVGMFAFMMKMLGDHDKDQQ
jgi:uncharacterized membrane protein YbhN (UPF0104 family)